MMVPSASNPSPTGQLRALVQLCIYIVLILLMTEISDTDSGEGVGTLQKCYERNDTCIAFGINVEFGFAEPLK